MGIVKINHIGYLIRNSFCIQHMIYIKHPDPACNRNQEELISALPAEQRQKMIFTFLLGNITYRYHQEASEFKPTLEDWKEWLEGLPSPIRAGMENEGFEKGKRILSFTRYVLEKHDVGLDAYIKGMMKPEDYADYQSMVNLK